MSLLNNPASLALILAVLYIAITTAILIQYSRIANAFASCESLLRTLTIIQAATQKQLSEQQLKALTSNLKPPAPEPEPEMSHIHFPPATRLRDPADG